MIDTHVHVACPDLARWPRNLTGVGSDWHNVGGAPEEVIEEARRAGVERLVIVQAVGVYGEDASCAAAVVAGDPQRLAFVGAVVLPGHDRVAVVEGLSGLDVRLAGVRLFALAAPVDVFDDDGADRLIERVAGYGAVPVVTVFPEHLPALARLARRHPTVFLVVDHCGFPERGPGLDVLHDVPNVVLKVTTHVIDHVVNPRAWLAGLRDAVGADRLCWGSDHPQHPGSYVAKIGALRAGTAGWSSSDVDALTTSTAQRLFHFDE